MPGENSSESLSAAVLVSPPSPRDFRKLKAPLREKGSDTHHSSRHHLAATSQVDRAQLLGLDCLCLWEYTFPL